MKTDLPKKVVVIGSNSFSGSDFIDLLLEDENYKVIGISRSPEKPNLFLSYKRHSNPEFTFYQMDLNRDFQPIIELLNSFRPQYIVNFAALSEVAPSWEEPKEWFQTNMLSIASLAHELRHSDYLEKFIQISTPEVYGTCEGVVREDARLNPSTPYAASKAACDLSLLPYLKNFSFPLITVRSTNVYGARQQLHKIIPRTIISVKQSRKIKLHGGGRAVKSYIHIRDVSRGELAILKEGRMGDVYHLSPDTGHTIKELVNLICKKMEVDPQKHMEEVEDRLGQDAQYVINSEKVRNQLHWKPAIGIDEGISKVIQWVDREWDAIQHQPLEYIHKR